ncbi:MAG: hypothetical protein KGO82_16940, partial [Bacteroidota bacterium]|nr:hypothetical protein [Bacteroidota bacterium]
LPSAGSAWLPLQLEYGFSLGAPAENGAFTSLTAEQYAGGHLDWYSFDTGGRSALPDEQQPATTKPVDVFQSFIPSPVTFKGMPNPRFWMMEDNQTDFGKIDTSPTGMLHLFLAEFGLIYGNDWFLLPYQMSVNSLCKVSSMVVTDTFGQHILIQPAGKGAQANWQRWSMFQLTNSSNKETDGSLFYLPPAINNMQEGEPVEQVQFLRDEMANMVWAVETVLPSQAGQGVSGNELALTETADPGFVPVNDMVAIRYLLGTTVPENWIPFMPVHMPGSNTEIRLQRAKMPGAKGPGAAILSEVPPPYFINEEEIPRAGIAVKQTFQRARWAGGATWLWSGRAKQAGKGEGWSNLKFDQIEDIQRKPQ